ncbi:MAG: hypothetical protein JKY37_17660, partial [Nannocystaceae bacterium]|nr:hypothetical protein [Nannocystaceae bacterium]
SAAPGVCGDGTCAGGESTDSCEIDCPPCGFVAAEGETIDNGDACFLLEGPAQYWRNESRGHGGDLSWTKSTTGKVFNSVVWDLFLEAPGDFKVEVFIEPGIAGTHRANYQLIHDGVEDVVVVDQASASGWTDVGTFGFAAGGRQSLRLGDKTGESGKKIVVDAMRITPADGAIEEIYEEIYGEQDDGQEPGIARGQASGACSVGDTDRGPGVIWALLGLIGWLRRRNR